jgi:multidrug efflux pump subunit AcrB
MCGSATYRRARRNRGSALGALQRRVAVGINILKSAGFSTTAVGDAIHSRSRNFSGDAPCRCDLRIVQDAGVRVETSVFSVQEALIEGAALTSPSCSCS